MRQAKGLHACVRQSRQGRDRLCATTWHSWSLAEAPLAVRRGLVSRASMQYQQDEKVLCFHGPLMYQAKILMAEDWKGTENQHGAVGPHYFVHYQGWKKTWDEWVPDSRLLKYTEENLARQKALVDAHKAEAAAAAAVAAAHAENAASRSKADTRHKGAASGLSAGSSRRGSKRSRDASEADDHERKPDMHLVLPESLKSQLVDDWENVTRKEQLVPLPRTPNVKQILEEYAELHRTSDARSSSVLSEVLAGLQLYFDKSLAQNLLYRFEREQYVQMRKQHGPKACEDEPKPARRGRASQQEVPVNAAGQLDLEASDMYGAEHLLRLFVNLPDIVSQTNMDPESVSILRDHVHAFLAFLAQEQKRLFCQAYQEPSPAYHRLHSV